MDFRKVLRSLFYDIIYNYYIQFCNIIMFYNTKPNAREPRDFHLLVMYSVFLYLCFLPLWPIPSFSFIFLYPFYFFLFSFCLYFFFFLALHIFVCFLFFLLPVLLSLCHSFPPHFHSAMFYSSLSPSFFLFLLPYTHFILRISRFFYPV